MESRTKLNTAPQFSTVSGDGEMTFIGLDA